ncbi:uncharacterized protein DUF5134 [Haloactinopolyspora alba]|uniref:Uncharacterized protein DUF5134 n=1 Tax=Haloactinopolyspora alba TaxID=648780 RepID=A0A2P8EBL7_9ACTN|nr:DUF5134 domain-containing protein [Haloactinopolyspora alba]PSL06869.1 uncharacterized protein DUF5134 [Haloactinopolyspora alba]
MSPIELFRTALAVMFSTAAVYSLARLASTAVSRRLREQAGTAPGALTSDTMHALTGVSLAALVSPHVPVDGPVYAALGIVAFALVAARFTGAIRQHGATSCAADDGRGRHGGYHLHHLVACAAMIYLWTGTQLATGDVVGSTPFAAGAGGLGAPRDASLAGLNLLFGLYFLVAATSLGFRVAEPMIRITHRVAVPAGSLTDTAARATPTRTTRAERLTSPAGRCASEVTMSAGAAFVFLSAL